MGPKVKGMITETTNTATTEVVNTTTNTNPVVNIFQNYNSLNNRFPGFMRNTNTSITSSTNTVENFNQGQFEALNSIITVNNTNVTKSINAMGDNLDRVKTAVDEFKEEVTGLKNNVRLSFDNMVEHIRNLEDTTTTSIENLENLVTAQGTQHAADLVAISTQLNNLYLVSGIATMTTIVMLAYILYKANPRDISDATPLAQPITHVNYNILQNNFISNLLAAGVGGISATILLLKFFKK